MEFDEVQAVKYIKSRLGKEKAERYDDDDILLVIDAMYDYYEDHEDGDESDDEYFNGMLAYVKNAMRKDKDNVVEIEDIPTIVNAEIEYELTLEDE